MVVCHYAVMHGGRDFIFTSKVSSENIHVVCSLAPSQGSKALVATLQSEPTRGQAANLTLTIETTPLELQLTPKTLSTLMVYAAQHAACLKSMPPASSGIPAGRMSLL